MRHIGFIGILLLSFAAKGQEQDKSTFLVKPQEFCVELIPKLDYVIEGVPNEFTVLPNLGLEVKDVFISLGKFKFRDNQLTITPDITTGTTLLQITVKDAFSGEEKVFEHGFEIISRPLFAIDGQVCRTKGIRVENLEGFASLSIATNPLDKEFRLDSFQVEIPVKKEIITFRSSDPHLTPEMREAIDKLKEDQSITFKNVYGSWEEGKAIRLEGCSVSRGQKSSQ